MISSKGTIANVTVEFVFKNTCLSTQVVGVVSSLAFSSSVLFGLTDMNLTEFGFSKLA
jgi:hypothetical protein